MKYIKKFNESSDSYYEEISYASYIDSPALDITSNEYVFITKKIDSLIDKGTYKYRMCEFTIYDGENKDRDFIFDFYKTDDDYYMLADYTRTSKKYQNNIEKNDRSIKYYRCDGLDGLIEFLENRLPQINIIKESTDNDYYSEIYYNEYNELPILKLSDKEHDLITSEIFNNTRFMSPIGTERIKVLQDNNLILFDIMKTEDSYYIVSDFRGTLPKYYKCDELEGLLQFIEDKLNC